MYYKCSALIPFGRMPNQNNLRPTVMYMKNEVVLHGSILDTWERFFFFNDITKLSTLYGKRLNMISATFFPLVGV